MIKIVKASNNDEYRFLDAIAKRADSVDSAVEKTVADILQDIKQNGDKALIKYCKKFDNSDSVIRYGKQDFEKAFDNAELSFKKALQNAAKNITEFHMHQQQSDFSFNRNLSTLGQLVRPLARVGIYVPGGTAAYPSSVLMCAIPAKLASVDKVIMVTPPKKDGSVNTDIMVAAYIAGVDEMLVMGGAHGIAALAYGTETIVSVDKIVGPGNIYVATAKRMVYGSCDIDMIAGPSEIMIMADSSAKASYVAADLLSQAEHDTLASAILVTTSNQLAKDTVSAIASQLPFLERQDIIKKSLSNYGGIIVVNSVEKMLELVNFVAPEHLEIVMENAFEYLPHIKNAGSIFLGSYTPEALGDYYAGSNHVLPTGGSTRFFSPLSVDSFVKKIQYISYTKSELLTSANDIICLANREGLSAHANSVKIRLSE